MEYILPMIPLLILVVAIYLLARYLQKRTQGKNANGDPIGIGGWLTLLVLALLVGGPLTSLGVIGELGYAEYQHQAITKAEGWKTYYMLMSSVGVAASAISVYGGWGLAKGKDWSVVTRALVVLWVTGPITSVLFLLVIPAVALGTSATNPDLFVKLLLSVIAASIWTAYLYKSKRVKATYRQINEIPPPNISANQENVPAAPRD